VVAEIINHFYSIQDFLQSANQLAQIGVRVADYVLNGKGRPPDPQDLALTLALVLLPGMILAFLLWLGMLLMFRRGGVGGALASLNAREPSPTDLKELQLADVAQEMAIAAGLPAPKVMLVDSAGANAAAIGTSAADARIVISRRLLDDLDRDQLQAVLAHLIGSIGNGDLHIAFTVTSVFETCGLLLSLINAPFGRESRHRVWRVIRYILGRGTPEQKAVEAAAIAASLAGSIDANNTDIDRYFNAPNPGLFRKVFRIIFFPFLFTNLAVEITLWFFLNLLLGPCMALLWRTRRYLADASSVELTRNPDALARALQRLSEDNTALAGSEWATHLFVVNPVGDRTLRGSEGSQPTPEQLRKAAEVWRATAPDGSAESAAITASLAAGDITAVRKQIVSTWMAAMRGDQKAVARMEAIAAAARNDPDLKMHDIPNVADILAAQRGDRAARARIAQAHQAEQQQKGAAAKGGQSGLQIASYLSFHPPLKRRAKRLERMGSHLAAPAKEKWGLGLKIFVTVLYSIMVPLLAAAGVLMLIAIAMMIMLNLMMLMLWLTVIHWIFVWWNSR
jgi:Zn-dependent protease with chaperone function